MQAARGVQLHSDGWRRQPAAWVLQVGCCLLAGRRQRERVVAVTLVHAALMLVCFELYNVLGWQNKSASCCLQADAATAQGARKAHGTLSRQSLNAAVPTSALYCVTAPLVPILLQGKATDTTWAHVQEHGST